MCFTAEIVSSHTDCALHRQYVFEYFPNKTLFCYRELILIANYTCENI